MPSRAYTSFLRKVSSGYPQCISECVNALSGLSCYLAGKLIKAREVCFNALTGLSCYQQVAMTSIRISRFNALTGLSCYQQEYTIF